MGKKNEPSIETSIKCFKDIIARMGLTDGLYQNHTIISKVPKIGMVGITVDDALWNHIIDDESIKGMIKEVDPTNKETIAMISIIDNAGDWLPVDANEIYSGKVIPITIAGFEYDILVNKDMLPIKLKKAEVSDISYQIVNSGEILANSKILKFRKTFVGSVESSSFSVMRLFIIA